jgi:hypothetical protein
LGIVNGSRISTFSVDLPNAGDRRESIFQTDRNRALFPETRAQSRWKTGWQGDAQKLKPARRLRKGPTMTCQWIANQRHMGVAGSMVNRLRGGREESNNLRLCGRRLWNHPVVAGDRLYLRNSQEAAGYQLPLAEVRTAAVR